MGNVADWSIILRGYKIYRTTIDTTAVAITTSIFYLYIDEICIIPLFILYIFIFDVVKSKESKKKQKGNEISTKGRTEGSCVYPG